MEYAVLSWCLIGVICLRIFLFRPHWLANILTVVAMSVIILMLSGIEAGSGAFGGIVAACVFYTWLFHFLSKRYDKKRAAKQAAKSAGHQEKVPAQQPFVQPQQPATKPVPVQQTLTTCVRCGKSLHGPKCKYCGFDHTAQPVLLLCSVDPQKLQIQMEQ